MREWVPRFLLARAELKTKGRSMGNWTGEPPAHWVTQVRPARGWALFPIRDMSLLRGLQTCLETRSGELCRTAQALHEGTEGTDSEPYTCLRLARAWRLEHHFVWSRYCQAMAEIESHLEHMPQRSVSMRNEVLSLSDELCDWAVSLNSVLNEKANEKLLAHGTKPGAVAQILASGLNERFCSSAVFGQGTYLAEDAGKCDQYAAIDRELGDFPELHELLYREGGAPHPSNIRYLFICRVALGAAVHTVDGSADTISGAPVWAKNAPVGSELAAVPGSSPPVPYHSLIVETGGRVARYREVVLTHGERVYPEYLVAYQRR